MKFIPLLIRQLWCRHFGHQYVVTHTIKQEAFCVVCHYQIVKCRRCNKSGFRTKLNIVGMDMKDETGQPVLDSECLDAWRTC